MVYVPLCLIWLVVVVILAMNSSLLVDEAMSKCGISHRQVERYCREEAAKILKWASALSAPYVVVLAFRLVR